jgi:LysM repeat protein/ABC-type branched-subunit amino acid transport system substrate-binding protein
VQKGQTLYSISKAYEVTQEEIKSANPQVDVVNLVEGLAIRIPASTVTKEAAIYPRNKEDFYEHSVKRKETVYSIARKYDVNSDVIYYYNPWAKDGIKQDQTLWIPKKEEMHDISVEARKDDAYYYYTVKPKDTLYSIAKTYGVSVADIINANPELRNGLRTDQTILIPKLPLPGEEEVQTAENQVNSVPCVTPDPSHIFNVALMLPFFASYSSEELNVPTDTLSEEGTYVPQLRERGLRGKNFAEFYEGFLLAVDSLKKAGLSVNLHVFDTERDTSKTKRILRELGQIQPDMVIGPVYAEDVNIAGRFARFQNIHLLSPLSTRQSLVNNNSNIIQLFPSRQAESYAMANYLRQFKKGRIILISGTDQVSAENSRKFRESLMANMPVNENSEPLFFKDFRLNDSLLSKLGTILSKEEENLLVVFSDSEPDVNSLVSRLIQRVSLYPVVLFGMPSWQGFSTDLNFFHTLKLHLITPFYTDFSNQQVRKYLKKSRNHYGYEPYEVYSLGYNFSMLGYDIGLYFLTALKQYGRNFMPCNEQLITEQLLTRYHFTKTPNGGYVNNNFNLIYYSPDYTIERKGIISGEPAPTFTITAPFDPSSPPPSF